MLNNTYNTNKHQYENSILTIDYNQFKWNTDCFLFYHIITPDW